MSAAREPATGQTRGRPHRPPRSSALFVGLGGALLAAALYFLLIYAPAEKAQAVEAWQARLNAMADDRAAAIVGWVEGGISDAATVATFPTVVTVAQAGRQQLAPGSPAVTHLREVLDDFLRAKHQRGLLIMDRGGAVVAGESGEGSLSEQCLAVAKRSVRGPGSFADFCSGQGDSPLVIFGAPIVGPVGGTDKKPAPLGMAVVASDPAQWLYPLLAREPLPTLSGEVVLARRDSDGILFLSPLRRGAVKPLTLKLHTEVWPLAARAAVEGWESFGMFIDYRGVRVFASARRIRGTSWGLVAKIDQAEALATYRDKIASSGLTVVGFALALVGTGVGLWRARRATYEAALARSRARLALLFDHANDAILFVGTNGRIIDANRKAELLYGYTRAELLRLSLRNLRAEEALGVGPEQMEQASSQGGRVFRTTHRRKDGSNFPVEVSSRLAEFEDARAVLSIVRDLSDREAAEERIRFLNSVLRAITEIGELTVRERNQQRILEETCRIAVEHGQFRMAWVGLADLETGEVRAVASAGYEEGYLGEVEIRCDDTPEGRGPTGVAIRARRAVVVNDWQSDARVDPWREAASKHFFRSSAAFPIVVGDQVRGAFSVYSEKSGVFEPEVVGVLERLAQDLGFALQVTEGEQRRLEAERALRESEERFRALIEKSADLLLVVDSTGTVTFAGPSSIDALGYPPEELVGASVFAFVHPDDVPRVREVFEELQDLPGEGGRVEMRAHHRNGSWRVFDAVQRSLFHVPGVRGLVMNARDITERQLAEATLRESERRYRLLVDNLQDVVVTFSTTGVMTSFNAAFERITGWPASEWIGKGFPTLVHPADLAHALGFFTRVLRQESPGLLEVRIKARDGSWLDAEFTAVELLEDGHVVGALGTGRDITHRKRAEEALRSQAQIIDQVHEAVVSTDLEGYVTSWNRGAERLFGYSAEEALGKHVAMLYPEEGVGVLEKEVIGQLKQKGAHEVEVRVRRKTGEHFWIHLAVSLLHDGDGRPAGMIGYSLDITERRRLEAELRQAQKMEAIGRLAGGVAHDFNNLLQAMLSHAEIITASPDDAARVAASVMELEQQIRRGAALSRQLLLFSRRETAKRELLDVNEAVRGAIQLLQRLIRENVALSVELAAEPLPVVADRGQLDQVLTNLVVNATDAMPAGGTLVVRTGEAAEQVLLCVEDTGAGIPAEIRDHIFEPFFTTKVGEKGSGLGLSVVHGIVTQHGGTIDVSDRAGGGTVFRIELPRAKLAETQVVSHSPAEGGELPRGEGERIVVVEDEAGARGSLLDLLQMLGYRVTAVGSAEEAKRLPSEPPFALVLSDVLLPDASGTELTDALRERWPGLKVVLMSGYTEDDAIRRAVRAGTVRFLQKPFDMRRLATEIRASLAES
jgi:two-component system cell cycle sensor histidine kinase/response regulator CckA